MKKSWIVAIIVLVISCVGIGCANTRLPEGNVETGNTEKENTEEENTQNENTEEGNTQDENIQDVVTSTEYGDDGSISVISKDAEGKIVERIIYDAANNLTTHYLYEYNAAGVLSAEVYYEGNGNCIAEFAAGNYENAVGFGQNNYDSKNDYDVDIPNAFVVTIKELAPLYQKAEMIWDTYGVAVLIADKVCSYTDDAEKCYDYKQIEGCLNLIESALACYPKDFFRDFSDNNVNTDVCIQLVGTGSAAGLYIGGYEHLLLQLDVNCYTPEDDVDDKGEFFCYTLHHELFHMISEKLIERASQSDVPLTEEKWNSYNPEGFAYVGYYDDDLESALYSSGDNSEYFVYSYSCSTPDEDRAIIFGKAMTYYQRLESNTFNDKVDKKLKYLSDCIRAGFDSADWPEKMSWDYILEA